MEYKKNIVPTQPAKKGEFVALDCEFFGQDVDRLHIPHGEFACLSIAYSGGIYQVTSIDLAQHALQVLKPGQWCFHNALYDIRQLRRFFSIAPRPIWDTMLVERVLWGGYYSSFALDDLARRYLGMRMEKEVRTTFERVAAIMNKKQSDYAAKDAAVLLEIAEEQNKLLVGKQKDVYWDIDAPMIWAVLDMPPVKVDVEGWTALVNEFQAQASKREEELGFNVVSGPQVKAAVKNLTGIKMENTQGLTLENLMTEHPVFKQIIDTRAYRKAVSTYGMSWLAKNVDEAGLVHPSWKVTGAETGRMSCASPNLQQIPARNVELGMQRYRSQFISRHEGGSIVVFDVVQQEPRITAYASQDETLLGLINKGVDLHQAVADMVGKVLGHKVSRGDGKTLNLGLGYGLSAYGLAQRTGMSAEDAEQLVNGYFKVFRGVASWIAVQRNFANTNEYVETAAGRRIHINLYNSQWENNAINAPIQGGAADHTKLTVSLLWKKCRATKMEFPVCMVVHDEVVLDCAKGTVTEYKRMAKEAWLEAAASLFPGVPFAVESATGNSWGAKQEEAV
jgi:DNA polymerase-1